MKVELIQGKNINFRNVVESDSAFILGLRLDNRLSQFMAKTDSDLDKQIQWIRDYQKRPQEYYFIIENKDKQDCGTIRIYDIQEDSFCWGSWIIKPGSPSSVAIESVLLVYDFGYFKLGFKKCHFDVVKKNLRVIDFHKRFGAKIVSEDDTKFYFNLTVEDYQLAKQRYVKYLS